jgi:hypothetical protein
MKALTIINPSRMAVFGRVLNQLISRGIIGSWVALPIQGREELSGKIDEKFREHIVYLEESFFKDRYAANAYLESLQEKFCHFHFGTVLAAEKRVPKYFPRGIIDIANMIKGCEQFFDHNSPDILISDFPSSSLDMVVYQFAKSRKVPTIFINGFRTNSNLLFCYEPEKGLKEYISYLYYQYESNGLTEDNKRKANEFLTFFKRNSLKPTCYKYTIPEQVDFSKYISPNKLISFISDLFTNSSLARSRVETQVRKFLLKKEWKNIFVPIDDRDRIIFFPLHFQPEASTNVRSPYFRNQYSVIENLCLSMPAGFTLYVKEHSRHIFQKSPSLFKRYLGNYPNLKFLDPSVDSHEIIKKSELVVVLSGTAGWEAFLYGIPVLQFGTAFYGKFKGIYRFQNFNDLSNQIREILNNHEPDEEEILTALSACFDGTFPGFIDDPQWNSSVLENNNITNIANTVIKGMEFYPVWQKFIKSNAGFNSSNVHLGQ